MLGDPVQKAALAVTRLDNAADFDFAKKFRAEAQTLLDERRFRTHPVQLRHGGLDGIMDGLDDIKNDGVSGQKLVYTL